MAGRTLLQAFVLTIASGERTARGANRCWQSSPNPKPPKPLVSFKPHTAANGVSFSHSSTFGFEGDAFVALFGDIAPITTPRLAAPRGFKVVRVDMRKRKIVDFAVNKIAGPASQLRHGGFERPSHCAFGPDGALYVVDYGKIQIAPEVGGVRMVAGHGCTLAHPAYRRQVGHGAAEAAPCAGLCAAVWAGRSALRCGAPLRVVAKSP